MGKVISDRSRALIDRARHTFAAYRDLAIDALSISRSHPHRGLPWDEIAREKRRTILNISWLVIIFFVQLLFLVLYRKLSQRQNFQLPSSGDSLKYEYNQLLTSPLI